MTNNFKIHGMVDKEFIKVPKAIIRDKTISAEARIILTFLIDLTGDFSVNERGVSSLLGISLFKVGKAISELENAGYITKKRIMNKSQFAGWFWDISAVPIFKTNTPYLNFSDMRNSDTNNSDMRNSDMRNSDTNFSDSINQLYIKDRKDIKPTDTRIKEENTKGEKTEGSGFAHPTASSNQAKTTAFWEGSSEAKASPLTGKNHSSGTEVISQADLATHQAFNRFCELYPNLGDRGMAQQAFFAISDINNICWKIVNSVEWFEKSKRWDDWKTGQKNVVCPRAAKFLSRGDWQQYLKSGADMSRTERLAALLPDEEDEYETN